MPANRKPKAWNLKPQMTAAPELWRDCVFLEPFWESPRDIVHGFVPVKQENGGYTIDVGYGVLGREALEVEGGTAFAGAAYRYGGANETQHDVGSGDFTAFVYCRYVNKNDISSAFGKKFSGGTGSEGWALSVNTYQNSGEDVLFELDNNGTAFSIKTATGVAPINEPFVIVGVRRGGTIKIFVNGDERSSATVSGSFSNTSAPLQVGSGFTESSSPFGTQFGWTGSIYMAGLCKRAWSDEEVKAFSKDPFAMLRPAGF